MSDRPPNGRVPSSPADDGPPNGGPTDDLAAEYVLGTLDAATAARVRDALPNDAALRAAVEAWEARLAPLSGLAMPLDPPAGLWDRIEARIAPPARAPRTALWRGWAVGATALAAGLAAFVWLRPPAEPRMMTVLVSDRALPSWTAEVDRGGGLRLAAMPAPGGAPANRVPPGRALELWALPPGATRPTSLGVLPPGQGAVTIPTPALRPVEGMLIEISLEPEGGSPTGLPTGPVLFIGRLTQAAGS